MAKSKPRRDCCDVDWKSFLVRTNCDPRDSCSFELSKECEEIFDELNAEHTNIAGTEIDFWLQDLTNSIRDPLYSEPENRIWAGPFRIKALVKLPDDVLEVREEGGRRTWTGKVIIPRLLVEQANMPAWPGEGDILRIWQIPFWDAEAMGDDVNVPGTGLYFDVTQVNNAGFPFDNANFTRFEMDIVRRNEFTPERRLFNRT